MTFVNTTLTADCLHEAMQSPFEQEMARLIVDTLQLESDASDIAPRDALFHDGLGLDSIDALELALAISKQFGVELKSDDARNGEVFASLRSLSTFVAFFRQSKDGSAAACAGLP
jgi:acyl carrier protein